MSTKYEQAEQLKQHHLLLLHRSRSIRKRGRSENLLPVVRTEHRPKAPLKEREFHRPEEVKNGVYREAGEYQGIDGRGEIEVSEQGCHALAEKRRLTVSLELDPQRGTDLCDVLVDACEGTKFLYELRGSFRTDAGDARKVIGSIAAESFVGSNLVGADAVLRKDFHRSQVLRRLVAFVGNRDADPLVCDLECVSVSRDDRHLRASLLPLPSIDAEVIIGFVALIADVFEPKRLDALDDPRDLHVEVIGSLRSSLLIFLRLLMTERVLPLVETKQKMRGLFFGKD